MAGRPGARGVAVAPLFSRAALSAADFCLHPLNYALGLAAAAEAAGARIFEDTPVLEIDPAGVRKRVVTQHSRVRAAHVVLAGNVHMTELVPQFADTLLPIFSTTIITAPLGDELHDAIRYPGAVGDGDLGRPAPSRRGRRRLMWSGQSAVRLGKPQRHADALIRQIRRTYPALRDVKAEHAWIGVAGHTVHGMPQIGEVAPGLWLLERIRRPWTQHHGDGRRDGRACHRRGRPDLGNVLAVRPGLGRRRVRPRRAAGVRMVAPRARQA